MAEPESRIPNISLPALSLQCDASAAEQKKDKSLAYLQEKYLHMFCWGRLLDLVTLFRRAL